MVRERLRDGIADLQMQPVTIHMTYPFGIEETVEFYRQHHGPVVTVFASLPGDGQAALRREMLELYRQHNRATDGTTHIQTEYLEVVATRA